MSELVLTIGLEVHAELKTATKMFCRSKNDPDEKRANVNICPVCLAHPGTLPTINKQAVEHVLRVGLALGGKLADYTEFDRKNYFYPDIPKGYQISQYQFPLVSGGKLNGVELTRIHLEEDTARNQHSDSGDGESLVDFNRAGVPLMELVTEPVITSAKQAGDFARELQLLLRYLDVSEANMEKGEMRVEANISLQSNHSYMLTEHRGGYAWLYNGPNVSDPKDIPPPNNKVEVKNLNSFRAVERAIEYEFNRQKEVIESGGKVVQETRGWDDAKQVTFSQRKKESSHDYRYFPDPDLPKLKISEIPEFSVENLTKTLPELPWQKRERYAREYGIKSEDIEVFVSDILLDEFFEKLIPKLENKDFVVLASNFITNDVLGLLKKDSKLKLPDADNFAKIVNLFGVKKINSRQAKDQIKLLVEEGKMVEVGESVNLEEIIAKIIAENAKVVADYKAGKASALQFLIGQGMKASKGSANPEILKKLFTERLT